MNKFIALSVLTLALSSASALAATTTWEGQSPIDFNDSNVVTAPNNAVIQYHYKTEAVAIKNTIPATGKEWGSLVATLPNTAGIPLDTNSYVTINGEKYLLAQFHFHTESEHTVKTRHYPMEIHLVHLKVHDNGMPYCLGEPGSLLVIGAFINDSGSKKNVELDKIFGLSAGVSSLGVNEALPGSVSIDVKKLLPSSSASYRYHGSLTAPKTVSCGLFDYANNEYNSVDTQQLDVLNQTHILANDGSFPEAVSWVVLSTPISMSTAQIDVFKTLFPVTAETPEANSRPTVNIDHPDLPALARNKDRKVLFIRN